jgi:hypothetical protein
LGRRRSPEEVEWYNYCTDDEGIIEKPRISSCQAGMVYGNWRTLDGDGEAEEEVYQPADARFVAAKDARSPERYQRPAQYYIMYL